MKVLFLCVGNSCRSIMAESMARVLGAGVLEPCSAGLSPAGYVAGGTVDVLEEMGYPVGGLRSKGLGEVELQEVEHVVSLLGEAGLRVLPPHVAGTREAWDVRDPIGEDEAVYRSVARDVEKRVERLVAELGGGEPPSRG